MKKFALTHSAASASSTLLVVTGGGPSPKDRTISWSRSGSVRSYCAVPRSAAGCDRRSHAVGADRPGISRAFSVNYTRPWARPDKDGCSAREKLVQRSSGDPRRSTRSINLSRPRFPIKRRTKPNLAHRSLRQRVPAKFSENNPVQSRLAGEKHTLAPYLANEPRCRFAAFRGSSPRQKLQGDCPGAITKSGGMIR